MPTQRLGGDTVERLDLGPGEPERSPRSWVRAVALTAVGALLGWGAAQLNTGTPSPQAAPPSLIVGPFEQNLVDPLGPEFLITLFNTSTTRLVVSDVAPEGWDATSTPTSIPPRSAVEVPVDVTVDCAVDPPPSEFIVARVSSGGTSRTVRRGLPATSTALQELFHRRCSQPFLSRPALHDLVGTWVVEDGGPAFTGKMLIRLGADGSYAMDAGTHLADRPGASGRFVLGRHGTVTLTTQRGGDCLLGRRARWDVGLLSGGRLHIRLLTAYDGFCSVEPGDVWIAKRVS